MRVDPESRLVAEARERCHNAYSAQSISDLTWSEGLIPIFFVASKLKMSVYAVRKLYFRVPTVSSPARLLLVCCRFPCVRRLALWYHLFADYLSLAGQVGYVAASYVCQHPKDPLLRKLFRSLSSSFRLLRSETPTVCFCLGNTPYRSEDAGLTISVPKSFSARFPVDIAAESALTACKILLRRWPVFGTLESIRSVVLA